MKSAIANAVATYAQAADHRHPRCVTPVSGVPSTGLADQQAVRIVDLEGKLASAVGKLHDANNRITLVEGALELIASLLGLPADATAPQILTEAMRRIK